MTSTITIVTVDMAADLFEDDGDAVCHLMPHQ